MAQAFVNVKPENRAPNAKLLLEYGADPNAFVKKVAIGINYQGATPLHMVIYNLIGGKATLEDSEILMLALLRTEGINA